MRRYTPKRQAEEDDARATREQFDLDHSRCWACGERRLALLETHHIGGRNDPQRHARANLSRFCRTCHCGLTDYAGPVSPIAACLAYKRLRDPAYYDRLLVLRIRGRGPECVTEAEVEAAVARIKRGENLCLSV